MSTNKVIRIEDDTIIFDNGIRLESYHAGDCCERHYLDFKQLDIKEFDGLEFDLSGESFFNRIPDYGIELVPISGHSVKIPGYSDNNGYYSNNLSIEVTFKNGCVRKFDITECQIDEHYGR